MYCLWGLYVCACSWNGEKWSMLSVFCEEPFSWFFKTGFTYSSLIQHNLSASGLSWSSWLYICSARIRDVHQHAQICIWMLGLKLRSSQVHIKQAYYQPNHLSSMFFLFSSLPSFNTIEIVFIHKLILDINTGNCAIKNTWNPNNSYFVLWYIKYNMIVLEMKH